MQSTPRHAYGTVWFATLLFFAGFYALLTPLPRHLAAVGMPDWQIGLVLGAFGVASLLGRPFAGLAADQLGPRAVMLAGAAALLIGALGVLVAADLVSLFLLRLLQAFGYVAFSTAGTSLVVTLTAPEQRGQRLAVFGAAANVAITLTPAGVSLLLSYAPLATGFALAAALALLAGGLALRLPVRTAEARAASPLELGFPRTLWASMAAAALFGVGFTAFFQFVPILAVRRGTIDAGWLYTIYGIGLIAIRFGGGQLVDALGIAPLLTVASLLMAGGLALFSIAASAAPLIFATLLIAASGLFHPALIAHHALLLPAEPGRASAAFYTGFDLGIGLGSWLLGTLLGLGGPFTLYSAAALAAAAVLLVVPAVAQQRRHN
jgi:predicted MFS family arabinose efflux permease